MLNTIMRFSKGVSEYTFDCIVKDLPIGRYLVHIKYMYTWEDKYTHSFVILEKINENRAMWEWDWWEGQEEVLFMSIDEITDLVEIAIKDSPKLLFSGGVYGRSVKSEGEGVIE